MCDGRHAAGALGLLLVLSTSAAAQTIDTIVVERRDVFGPESMAPRLIARLGDALHQRTLERVVRRNLLIDAGDAFDSARVAEAARALRALGVFRDVRTDTASLTGSDGGRFALVVHTADGWSTKPQFEIRSNAGDASWQAGIVEENVLGTATYFAAIYGHTPDRDYVALLYRNPSVLRRRARLEVAWNDLTDGRFGGFSYGLPFTETRSRHALATHGFLADHRVIVYRDGVRDTTYRRRLLLGGVTAGIATRATTTGYVRLYLGAQVRREDFGPDTAGAVLPRSVFGQVRLGIEAARSRWVVRRNLDTHGRPEDVDLSPRVAAAVALMPRAAGYPAERSGLGLEWSGQLGAELGSAVAVAGLRSQAAITAGGVDSARVAGRLTVATPAPRQHVIVNLQGAAARRVAPGGEYDLWAQRTGPRLFGAHAFTGTRAWSAILEDRIRVADDFAGLLGIGVAPFLEHGGAWYADQRPRSGGNAGLALRFAVTSAASGDVFELSGGWRWSSDGLTTGWAVAFGTAYRFLSR